MSCNPRSAARSVGPALAIAGMLSLPAGLHAAAAPDSTKAAQPSVTPTEVKQEPPVPHLFTRGDLLFLGGTAAATALAISNDQWLTDQAVKLEDNPDQQRVANIFQPLGQTLYVLGGTGALYGASLLMKRPQLARRSARIGLAVVIGSGVATGLKLIAGRERPEDSPHHSDRFKAFSGSLSFPSGHAATAFAAAVAIDRETSGRWVPFVVYPAAALVGWSRVHDQKHWTSDVVGGAAIGGWTAWKVENFLANRALGVAPQPHEKRTSLFLAPESSGMELVMTRVF